MNSLLTQAEQWALKWLQINNLPGNLYSTYAPYFQQLIESGWSEESATHLSVDAFQH